MTSWVERLDGSGAPPSDAVPAPAVPQVRPSRMDRLARAVRESRRDTRAIAFTLALTIALTAVGSLVHVRPTVLAPTYGTLLFALTGLTLSRLDQRKVTIAIVLAGLGLYFAYLGYTSYGERNYDPDAQLGYIKWIVEHHARPPASHCLVCHHPPLYYALGAGVYAFCTATKIAPAVVGLQAFSLVCFVAFVVFAVLTIERLSSSPRVHALATALVVFWPYSVQMSVRVHNDVLACTLMAAAAYFAVRYAQEDDLRSLLLATVMTALCLLTKSNGYVLALVIFVLLAMRFRKARKKRAWLARASVVGAVLAIALGLNTLGKGKSPIASRRLCEKVLGNACDLYPGQFVGNDPYNYVYIDLRAFLQEPYMLAEREGTGRQFFWNHFLKSSLFATHNTSPDRETSYALNRAIAGILSAVLLAMVLYLVVGAFGMRKVAHRPFAVAWLYVGSAVLFMIGFRVLVPAPHHADFRHVFPIVVPLSLLYATVVEHHRRREAPAHWIGSGLATSLVALSILYFLPKQGLVARFSHPVIERDLKAYATPAREGTPWDAEANVIFEDGQTVRFKVAGAPTAKEVELSVDNNDKYEVKVVGAKETRTIQIGPSTRRKVGLVRYVQKVEPPVESVKTLEVRALSGDLAYSIGHAIVR